jgi:hypothetical protein
MQYSTRSEIKNKNRSEQELKVQVFLKAKSLIEMLNGQFSDGALARNTTSCFETCGMWV